MLAEIKNGIRDADETLSRIFGVESILGGGRVEVSAEIRTAPEMLHYRLSWLFYLMPDSAVVPQRAPLFSRFHGADARVPEILSGILLDFKDSIAGIFPEPLAATEDLGYLVFIDQVNAIAAAGRLCKEVETRFHEAYENPIYVYGEFELSECFGTFTAPTAVVRRGVLLNTGYDGIGAASDSETIEVDDEIPAS